MKKRVCIMEMWRCVSYIFGIHYMHMIIHFMNDNQQPTRTYPSQVHVLPCA